MNTSKYSKYLLILIGIICISVGYNCLQHHRLEIAKQEKIIYKLYIECLYQKIDNLLEKIQNQKNLNYTKYGGEMYRLDNGDHTSK